MSPRPLVLVVTASDTLRLRLRLMVEAEGGRVAVAPNCAEIDAAESPALVLVADSAADQCRLQFPGVPVETVADGNDWEEVRRRLSNILHPADEARRLAESLSRARILLVDDSLTYREFLRHELARQGAQVTACGNAEEAVAALEGGRWDAVMVDLIMPGIDGIQLCARLARLRREKGGRHLLVVLSSREGRDDLVRSFEAGADAFLGKSQDPVLMRVRLGALLRFHFLDAPTQG